MGPSQTVGNMFSQSFFERQHEITTGSLLVLPLNLIALIIKHVGKYSFQTFWVLLSRIKIDVRQINAPGDLARICRTCRVLHYMTLPQLYSDVTIRSYDYIRYSPNRRRPEGCGMASPFIMALNGLVSRDIVGNVKTFTLNGEWKDYGAEECAKAGRVPDNDMMLSSLIRVALEKMTALQSFRYDILPLRPSESGSSRCFSTWCLSAGCPQ